MKKPRFQFRSAVERAIYGAAFAQALREDQARTHYGSVLDWEALEKEAASIALTRAEGAVCSHRLALQLRASATKRVDEAVGLSARRAS